MHLSRCFYACHVPIKQSVSKYVLLCSMVWFEMTQFDIPLQEKEISFHSIRISFICVPQLSQQNSKAFYTRTRLFFETYSYCILILLPLFVSVNGHYLPNSCLLETSCSASGIQSPTTSGLVSVHLLHRFSSTVGEVLLTVIPMTEQVFRKVSCCVFSLVICGISTISRLCTPGPSPVGTLHKFQPWLGSHILVLQTLICH